MILMLMRNQNRVQFSRIFPRHRHALQQLAARNPASTRTRVREEEMTVLLPLDPEASTVMRIIR